MERVNLSTTNILDENVEKLAGLFPEVVTEVRESDGSLRHAIDVEALKERVGDVAEGQRECYQFTWPGKRDAKQEAYRPIDKCLRPCPEESVNWDMTENLYIEGDNLDALKLLRNTYAGKIKMIYIDPPYNTGHDFIYDDDFARTKAEYDAESGDYDEEGSRLVANPESNGRFHSDWCSMMYPRLLLARDLLSEDGVIFISIDDGEASNAKRICDEVFGAAGFLSTFVWKRRASSALDSRKLSCDHEYVLSYSLGGFRRMNGIPKRYKNFQNPDNDPRGPWTTADLTVGMNGDTRPNQYYTLVDPRTGKEYPANFNRVWAYIPSSMQKLIDEQRVVFPEDVTKRPMLKKFVTDLKSDVDPISTWLDSVGLNSEGTREITRIFDSKSLFSYSKPISLIKALVSQIGGKDSVYLDFFSGSATTAHAVMKLNAEDDGNRKFIMVQLPEVCDEKSEAAKAGYRNICEIGKERIRRAGKKIAAEVEESNRQLKLGEDPKKVPDIGFRVLKIDSSNFRDVSAEPAQFTQETLMGLADNLKPDRTADDLLFQVLPQLQIPLSAPIEKLDIQGFTVYSVDGGRLVACFDAGVTTDAIAAMAKLEPDYAVMRDASFVGDDVVSNFGELFKTYSPATITKVI